MRKKIDLKKRIKLLWHCLWSFHKPAFDSTHPDSSFCWDCDYKP